MARPMPLVPPVTRTVTPRPSAARSAPPSRGRGPRRAAFELAQHPRRQGLAELDAPLVEAVDPPEHALDEGLVLVEGDQRAERSGLEPVQQDEARGPVAREGALRGEALDLGGGQALGASSARTSASLRPTIRASAWAMALASSLLGGRIAFGRLGARRGSRRGYVGPLVHQLEEGVLAVGAGVAEHRRRPWRGRRGGPGRPPACRSIPSPAAAGRSANRCSRWA